MRTAAFYAEVSGGVYVFHFSKQGTSEGVACPTLEKERKYSTTTNSQLSNFLFFRIPNRVVSTLAQNFFQFFARQTRSLRSRITILFANANLKCRTPPVLGQQAGRHHRRRCPVFGHAPLPPKCHGRRAHTQIFSHTQCGSFLARTSCVTCYSGAGGRRPLGRCTELGRL